MIPRDSRGITLTTVCVSAAVKVSTQSSQPLFRVSLTYSDMQSETTDWPLAEAAFLSLSLQRYSRTALPYTALKYGIAVAGERCECEQAAVPCWVGCCEQDNQTRK